MSTGGHDARTLAETPTRPKAGGPFSSKAVDTGLPSRTPLTPALRKARPGAFEFDDPRPARWNLDEGVWLSGLLDARLVR
jgi:hypothetical protein